MEHLLPLQKFSKLKLWIVAITGFTMSFFALRIDAHDFLETPFWFWLWVPICSLYPFLIALCMVRFIFFRKFPSLLLLFTVFGSIGYGLAAPVFYSWFMIEQGSFRWYEFGNIFWVWIYAGFAARFLLPYVSRVSRRQIGFVFLYFLIKDVLDRFSITWSYVRYDVLSDSLMNGVFVALLIVHGGLMLYFLRRRS